MNRKKSMLLFAFAAAFTAGMALLFAPSPGVRLEEIGRILLGLGAAGVIVLLAMGERRGRSPAYAGFGRQARSSSGTGMRFSDVAANREAKESLMGLADYLKNPKRYTSLGARMPRGVILYGPPGTGKTMLARALAGEADVPFFALSGSDFVQMYVGVGAGRVRELFADARKAGRCVIFIDEIDALGRRRADAVSEERDQTLNALLSEMSGFRGDEGAIVLAATNRIEALDPALLRPGRFDRQIEVGLPNREERLDILTLHSRNKPLAEDVSLEELSRETGSFSGASLESLLNEAAILAARRKSDRINRMDIERAFYRTAAGEDRNSPESPEERFSVAVHEAGHAVALRCLIPESRLKRVSILAAARGSAGYNLAVPPERTLIKKRDIENQICVLLAGRAAEVLAGGEDGLTSGASNDLSRAAELAGSMILDLGMAGEPAVSLRAVGAACGTGTGAEALCRETLNRLYERTLSLLAEQADALMALTCALTERETMTGEEIERVLAA